MKIYILVIISMMSTFNEVKAQNKPVPAIRLFINNQISGDTSYHFPLSKVDSILHYLITDVVVKTYQVQSITNKSAYCGGEVLNNGGGKITETGICYSTLPNPTKLNTHKPSKDTNSIVFSIELIGLIRNTKYYVRTYAINETGISYGNQVEFITAKSGESVVNDGYEYYTFTPDQTNDRFGRYNPLVVFQENLKTSRYSNGDTIRRINNFEEMQDAIEKKEGAWCYYNFYASNDSLFGKLYNNFALRDKRKLAPLGYHILTNLEKFQIFSSNEVNYILDGKRCKSLGTLEGGDGLWKSPNLGARNESGFTGLPGGIVRTKQNANTNTDEFYFSEIGTLGSWWVTESSDWGNAATLNYDSEDDSFIADDVFKLFCSVRCVKDY